MNLLAVVIGCTTATTTAFALGLYSYRSILIASLIGIAAGHTIAWAINKIARRELKCVRCAFLTPGPPWIPQMIDRIEVEGKAYYRVHISDAQGEIVQNLLPAESVSIRAGSPNAEAIIRERRLCIKSKLLGMLALCKMELVDYQVTAPFDKLP